MHTTLAAAYFATTVGFGLVRKGHQLRHATAYASEDGLRAPMLLTDKVAVTFVAAALAPVLWPLYVYQECRLLEMTTRSDLRLAQPCSAWNFVLQ